MSSSKKYRIELSDKFQRQAKKLLKKFPSLKEELVELRNSLAQNPIQGVHMGWDCYKIRIAIASKGKGKSGGARVITHVYITGKTVYLLAIFDKSEQETLSKQELKELLKEIKD
ncbi:MAG: hypothetical protein BRD50_00525 [Bacteroidetes bacterium SW_11_45_7]|nr:MAG: hypothetical protein BRD50_00525 [Bacteroidetes bacterium SW_11_45_7]